MGDLLVPHIIPAPVDYMRCGVNGVQVIAPFYQRIAYGMNHAMLARRKVFAMGHSDPASPDAFNSGTKGSPEDKYGGEFTTGEATQGVTLTLGLLKAITEIDNQEPGIRLSLEDLTGAEGTRTSDAVYCRVDNGAAAPAVPNDVHIAEIQMDVAGAGNRYQWKLQGWEYARLLWFTLKESIAYTGDTSEAIALPGQFTVHGPILDKHATDLQQGNNSLIKNCGAALLQHQVDEYYDRTLGTYATIFYGETVYMTLQTEYKDTRNRDIDVVWCVEGQMLTTGTGGCQLVDDGATQLGECSFTTTSRVWKRHETTIPATDDQSVKVQIKGDGTNTFRLYNWCLYIYDA